MADIILQSERGGSYLKVDHGRERGEDAGHKLGGVEQELGVDDEDGADLKVELLKPVDELAHHWDVCVQLYLTYTVRQEKWYCFIECNIIIENFIPFPKDNVKSPGCGCTLYSTT